MWRSIKMLLALKCDESTRLVSQSLDQNLPTLERWAVRLHAISCRSCRRFRHQTMLIRSAIQQRLDVESVTDVERTRLSDEASSRIATAVAENPSKDSS